jgi:hypothetical protein
LDENRIDFQIAGQTTDTLALLKDAYRANVALVPIFALEFLQLATLAAISVAISTRYGLALNMTAIILLYVVANLTRFVHLLRLEEPWKAIAVHVSYVLPNLSNFDLSPLIYAKIRLADDAFVAGAPALADIWQYVGLTGVYGLFYIGAALALAIALFRTR